ncbi:MAG TPA: PTS sugar transporter subunit IIA [Longimicrobiales bacterium]|nr:PTS sugar transporter subunit IIA [Longimicrobiales bacterium]
MLLTELLSIDRVKIPLEATTKDELLRELVALVTGTQNSGMQEEVLRAVVAREAVLSTGIGYGVAIPHGKSPGVRDLVMAAGRARVPIEYDALDGQPVQLFFLLIGPEAAAGPHIKALSRISRIVRRDDVRARLTTAPDPGSFLRALEDAEA